MHQQMSEYNQIDKRFVEVEDHIPYSYSKSIINMKILKTKMMVHITQQGQT
jgi:hypothetical protein